MALYPFQEQVFDLLMAGKSVILQAPTGAGKTRAAMYPFLRAWEYNEPFPRKCIYAVPMRVLANQFQEEYTAYVNKYKFQNPMNVKIQTGEHRDDPRFEADLIFATIDQVLSSFLISPYSLSRRLSNMNAGAIASAYLVFDEFHLFDPVSTLPTTLAMLKMLNGIAPFVLMTATFSGDMLEGLAETLNATLVPEDAEARCRMQALPSQEKTRKYHVVEAPMSAKAILRAHENHRRSLVICNVVDRTRRLFEALKHHPDRGEAQILLLHSRFLPEDRKRIEGQIRKLFKKGQHEGSWIVVATQAIEVGLDITSEVLHTELAPANAILQRAGRCARYQGETGDVYIYPHVLDESGEVVNLIEHVAPYMQQEETIQRTIEAFQACEDRVLPFSHEQRIVSQAHGPSDQQMLKGLAATQMAHRDKMARVMDGERQAGAGDLIRAVSSQLIVIHDNPQEVAIRPFAAESFSLHPGTVRKHVRLWQDAGQLDDRVHTLLDAGDTDERGHSTYTWKAVETGRDLRGAALLLIHPDLAGYDSELGLVLGRGTGYRARLRVQQRDDKAYGREVYRLESYLEHVQLVYEAFSAQVWPEMAEAASRMEKAFKWPAGIIADAAHMASLFHDVGKLNRSWQKWVKDYQQAISRPIQDHEAYAHTDFDPTEAHHIAQQHTMRPRPPHAVEGATAVAPLLARSFRDHPQVCKAAFTAIARHHGAFTKQGQPYTLVPQARDILAESLTLLPKRVGTTMDVNAIWHSQEPTKEKIRNLLINPKHKKEVLPYILIARALRRADQLGTARGTSI